MSDSKVFIELMDKIDEFYSTRMKNASRIILQLVTKQSSKEFSIVDMIWHSERYEIKDLSEEEYNKVKDDELTIYPDYEFNSTSVFVCPIPNTLTYKTDSRFKICCSSYSCIKIYFCGILIGRCEIETDTVKRTRQFNVSLIHSKNLFRDLFFRFKGIQKHKVIQHFWEIIEALRSDYKDLIAERKKFLTKYRRKRKYAINERKALRSMLIKTFEGKTDYNKLTKIYDRINYGKKIGV